jgi:hypothetical protein
MNEDMTLYTYHSNRFQSRFAVLGKENKCGEFM